jgi:hypothetical protein
VTNLLTPHTAPIVEAVQSGLPSREVAAKYNISTRRVNLICKAAKVRLSPGKTARKAITGVAGKYEHMEQHGRYAGRD